MITYNEFSLPVLTKDDIRIEWINLNEGLNGDFDKDDPADKNFLRFEVSRRTKGDDWRILDGGCCTLVEATTPHEKLETLLEHFMNTLFDEASAHRSVKKLCEHLSWTS